MEAAEGKSRPKASAAKVLFDIPLLEVELADFANGLFGWSRQSCRAKFRTNVERSVWVRVYKTSVLATQAQGS